MTLSESAARELAQLLDGARACDLAPELVRQALQALIKAEASAALVADRHECTSKRLGCCNGSR